MKELEETINAVDCDTVIAGTPIDLGSLLALNKPVVRAKYRIEEVNVRLDDVVEEWLEKKKVKKI
jgi:predicted GTPase